LHNKITGGLVHSFQHMIVYAIKHEARPQGHCRTQGNKGRQ